MSRQRKAASANKTDNVQPSAWSAKQRGLASALIAFHVFAVFISPFASPPPSSELAQATARAIQPYLKAMAIDNGYRFFAPDPVPSHLVRYVVELNDGSTVEGHFPDWETHWPRLLYHRHFMVSESLFNLTVPVSDLPPEGFATDEQRRQFDIERGRADALKYSLAKYLLGQHSDSKRVQLFLVEHQIPTPWDLQGGLKLDDPRLYLESSIDIVSHDDISRFETNAAKTQASDVEAMVGAPEVGSS